MAKPTKYKDPTTTQFDIPIDSPGGPVPATISDKPSDEKQSGEKKTSSAPELNRASAATARERTAGITPTDDMRDMLSRLQNINTDDEIDDTEAAHRAGIDMAQYLPQYRDIPEVIGQELATINQDIAAQDDLIPDWYAISNLPGYMQRAIRAMGRQQFSMFTRTPLEDIVVIANVNGQGPNSDRELHGVLNWLKNNAKDLGNIDIDYSRIMPGYSPRVKEYSTNNTRFQVVQDQYGKYIYAYPESDAVNIQNGQGIEHQGGGQRGLRSLGEEMQRIMDKLTRLA